MNLDAYHGISSSFGAAVGAGGLGIMREHVILSFYITFPSGTEQQLRRWVQPDLISGFSCKR